MNEIPQLIESIFKFDSLTEIKFTLSTTKFEKIKAESLRISGEGASNGTTCAERLAHLPLPVAHLYSACVSQAGENIRLVPGSQQKRPKRKSEL